MRVLTRGPKKSRGPLETAITRSILKTLNDLDGCYAVKTHGTAWTRRGEPDIRGVIHGRAFLLEVKRQGEGATPIQRAALERWHSAGAVVAVVTSKDEALRAIAELTREASRA